MPKNNSESPAKQGYRMPAEWEPHEATWLAWPHNRADWPGKYAPIPWVYTEIIRHLHTGEKIHLIVNDAAAEKEICKFLSKALIDEAQVRFFEIPTDRVWTRDYGPIFTVAPDGKLSMTHWQFNAWAKYDNWQKDSEVPTEIGKHFKWKTFRPKFKGNPVVLEGGSIDVNGDGLLLTTEECMLSPIQQRNPRMNRQDLEQVLAEYLGITQVLWLGQGILGDDTHGHVDDLARFVGPRRVVTALERNPRDPNYRPLNENFDRLRGMTDPSGKSLEVIPLPMPEPVVFQGQRLPASYANFYIGNEKVLVPTFNDPNDCKALGILCDLFPGRKVVGIHAVDLVWGLGTLHCMTQQQPRESAKEIG